MSFNPREDTNLFYTIHDWDGGRKISISIERAKTWTDEELSPRFTEEEVRRFRKNLEECSKSASERKDAIDEAQLAIALKRCVKHGESVFVNFDGVYFTGTEAIKRLAFEIYGSSRKSDVLSDWLKYSKVIRRIDTFHTRYIAVGDKFFDTKTGEMVDEAPDEFRTFKINRNVDYRPMTLKDCTSKLMRDFIEYLGEENIDFLLHYLAWNLTDLKQNKFVIYVYGLSRSFKSTFPDVCRIIGLAPQGSYSSDLRMGNAFQDALGQAIGVFVILPCDDVESINWDTVKAIHTDATIYINQKGVAGYYVPTRGFLYMSTNKLLTTGLEGLVNKLIILHSHKSFAGEIEDVNYLQTLDDNSFEEFICVLLTYAASDWNPYHLEGEVAAHNEEKLREIAAHEKFLDEWTNEGVTTCVRMYAQYLGFVNQMSENDLMDTAKECVKHPADKPKGLRGASYGTVRDSLKGRGFKVCVRNVKEDERSEKPVSTKCFEGSFGYKPPLLDGESDEIADYAGTIESKSSTELEVVGSPDGTAFLRITSQLEEDKERLLKENERLRERIAELEAKSKLAW